jgi:hypothetical protein
MGRAEPPVLADVNKLAFLVRRPAGRDPQPATDATRSAAPGIETSCDLPGWRQVCRDSQIVQRLRERMTDSSWTSAAPSEPGRICRAAVGPGGRSGLVAARSLRSGRDRARRRPRRHAGGRRRGDPAPGWLPVGRRPRRGSRRPRPDRRPGSRAVRRSRTASCRSLRQGGGRSEWERDGPGQRRSRHPGSPRRRAGDRGGAQPVREPSFELGSGLLGGLVVADGVELLGGELFGAGPDGPSASPGDEGNKRGEVSTGSHEEVGGEVLGQHSGLFVGQDQVAFDGQRGPASCCLGECHAGLVEAFAEQPTLAKTDADEQEGDRELVGQPLEIVGHLRRFMSRKWMSSTGTSSKRRGAAGNTGLVGLPTRPSPWRGEGRKAPTMRRAARSVRARSALARETRPHSDTK